MMMNMRQFTAAAILAMTTALAGCGGDNLPKNAKHYVPLSSETLSLLSSKRMAKSSPIMLRAYKKESEIEVWKQDATGQYALLKTYPMCRWSGQLGPKTREGDRQVPEGFYTITRSQLNPSSSFYLSFNIGYPNALDRSFGRTGAAIMVHGACTSMGCFSMTDEQIADIYALMREAFDGGQQSVQMQSMPFRMTAENLVRYRADDHMPFWRNLKEGSDHFEVTKTPPVVAACGKKYIFNPEGGGNYSPAAACPPFSVSPRIADAVSTKNQQDMVKVADLIRAGQPAVKRVYADGDQHESFNSGISKRNGRISQPNALVIGPRDEPVDVARQSKADALFLGFAARPPVIAPAATANPVAEAVPATTADIADITATSTPAAATPKKKKPLLPTVVEEPMPTSSPVDLLGSQY
jgi:murein L,D-transpeptidase YafK